MKLAKTLGLGALVVYAIGDILGAGIYALVGKVANVAGPLTWVAFAVALGVALVTALSYAELAGRYPHSGGAAHFCHQAFGRPWLTQWMGWLVLWSGVISLSTATVAFSGYARTLVPEIPREAIVVAFVTLVGFINFRGMRESSRMNLLCTAIELSGLIIVLGLAGIFLYGGGTADAVPPPATAVVTDFDWVGIFRGAALAFFAFIGFEDLANVAEEAHNPERDIPIAAIAGVLFAGTIFVAIAWIALEVLPAATLASSRSPLLDVVTASSPGFPRKVFAGIAMFAVANTGLLNFIMASRLLYGMASEGLLPKALSKVHATRRTPHVAILCVYAVVMTLSLLGKLEFLAATTSCLILTVFFGVHLALFVLKRREGKAKGFSVPLWLPVLGVVVTVGLVTFIPTTEKLSAAAFAGGSFLLTLVAGRKVRHGNAAPAA